MKISWALVIVAVVLSAMLVFPITPVTLVILTVDIAAIVALRYAAYWGV